MDPTVKHALMLISAILVINAIVRALKSDVTIPLIPARFQDVAARWRPVLAIGLGQLGAALTYAAGKLFPQFEISVTEAVLIGLGGSSGSNLLHSLVRDTIQGGSAPAAPTKKEDKDAPQ